MADGSNEETPQSFTARFQDNTWTVPKHEIGKINTQLLLFSRNTIKFQCLFKIRLGYVGDRNPAGSYKNFTLMHEISVFIKINRSNRTAHNIIQYITKYTV